jgi:hypothetical protein
MEETKYIQYVKTDENNNIIMVACSAFVKDPENWTAAGERTQRQWHINIRDNNGVLLYKLVDGVITDRTTTAKNADEKTNLKTALVSQIKQRAKEIINNRYPEWKQRNFNARAFQLLKKFIQSSLSAEEITEENNITAAIDWIKNVRDQSNTLENDLDSLTLTQLRSYTINFTE